MFHVFYEFGLLYDLVETPRATRFKTEQNPLQQQLQIQKPTFFLPVPNPVAPPATMAPPSYFQAKTQVGPRPNTIRKRA